jgi:Flp pilus assembly protein TadG
VPLPWATTIWSLLGRAASRRCADLAAFGRDQGGTVAIVVGLTVPLIVGVLAGAVDYGALSARHTQLQAAADGAALAAARELVLANSSDAVIAETAKRIALGAVNQSGGTATVATEVVGNRAGIRVSIDETAYLMMGKLIGWPRSELKVTAEAKRIGNRRICVLGLDKHENATIRLDHRARITAERCAVHSNSASAGGIVAFQEAVVAADHTCSAGGYSGRPGANFQPTPQTDCPQVPDPLAERSPPSATACDFNNTVIDHGEKTLTPGVYCGGLKVTRGAKVRLSAGEYIIDNGRLEVDNWSSLTGDYVGFYFRGPGAVLDFDPTSTISLSAPKSGAMAGILFFEDRAAPLHRRFRITSNNARRLLGTIYLPRGTLYIAAFRPIADRSAYTVVIARQLQLEAGPNLVLNSNFGATDVPLPRGVDAAGSDVALTR